MMDENLLRELLFRLKAYLQGRGLTVAVYRKNLLCEQAITVRHCKLPVDPIKIPHKYIHTYIHTYIHIRLLHRMTERICTR